jgi:hypothetical protein
MIKLPIVKLAKPLVSSLKTCDKSIGGVLSRLIGEIQQRSVVLDVLTGRYMHCLDRSGAARADDVLHLHRFDDAQFLPGLDRIPGLTLTATLTPAEAPDAALPGGAAAQLCWLRVEVRWASWQLAPPGLWV